MATPALEIRRVKARGTALNAACISCTAPEKDALTFAATRHWKIVLHPDQTVPGALLLTSLRHAPKISDLTVGEASEWFLLFRVVEVALEKHLGAAMVNVSCERNWAYRASEPDPPLADGRPNPHVHWHVAPRYTAPVDIAGERFHDVDFGGPLVWSGRRVGQATARLLMDNLFDYVTSQPDVSVAAGPNDWSPRDQ